MVAYDGDLTKLSELKGGATWTSGLKEHYAACGRWTTYCGSKQMWKGLRPLPMKSGQLSVRNRLNLVVRW